MSIDGVVMDLKFFNTGVTKDTEPINIMHIIPAKENKKIIRFVALQMKYSEENFS